MTVMKRKTGTDSGTWIMRVLYLTAGGSVLFLTLYRIMTAGAGRVSTAQVRSA